MYTIFGYLLTPEIEASGFAVADVCVCVRNSHENFYWNNIVFLSFPLDHWYGVHLGRLKHKFETRPMIVKFSKIKANNNV